MRDAHARWWAAWLDDHFAELHRDSMLDAVEEFHENLKAALDWTSRDPELGLALLARLLRPWSLLARDADALTAIDRLLTVENAERFPLLWVTASTFASQFVSFDRSNAAGTELLERAERIAVGLGDEFQLTLVRWINNGPHLSDRLRDLARARGDRYIEALVSITKGHGLIDDDPQNAAAQLEDDWRIAREERCSFLIDLVRYDEARAARDLGELARCREVGAEMMHARDSRTVYFGMWWLGTIGLLMMDEHAVRLAVEVAERRLPNLPGTNAETERARGWLRALTEGASATIDPNFVTGAPGAGALWFCCREALDAGERELALSVVRAQARPSPNGRAVLAAVEAAAGGDEQRWHEALRLAADHELRLVTVDALEGLAVGAARAESWAECLRLMAAARRLRDETSYRWRFRFERDAVESARAAAVAALGEQADVVNAEPPLEWREATKYAGRARGQRKRPRLGWASLTPTELQVVDLVAEGLTNPQIAERLLMGRATVKTHLEHIFPKLGVATRAELAAAAARRSAV